jgi:hypothetical protein
MDNFNGFILKSVLLPINSIGYWFGDSDGHVDIWNAIGAAGIHTKEVVRFMNLVLNNSRVKKCSVKYSNH